MSCIGSGRRETERGRRPEVDLSVSFFAAIACPCCSFRNNRLFCSSWSRNYSKTDAPFRRLTPRRDRLPGKYRQGAASRRRARGGSGAVVGMSPGRWQRAAGWGRSCRSRTTPAAVQFTFRPGTPTATSPPSSTPVPPPPARIRSRPATSIRPLANLCWLLTFLAQQREERRQAFRTAIRNSRAIHKKPTRRQAMKFLPKPGILRSAEARRELKQLLLDMQ